MGIILLNPKHKMVDIVAATTAVYTNAANKCPKSVTITLAGSAGTAWATDAIKKISTAILTDSDGYKMTLAFGKSQAGVATANKYEGGCVLAATGNAVCFRAAKYPSPAVLTTMVATWIVKKDWVITKLVAGTAITAAKWGLTYVPECNATATPVVAALVSLPGVLKMLSPLWVETGGNPRRPRRRYTLACLDSLLKKLPSGTLLTLLLSTLPPLAALVKPSPVPPPSLPEPLSPLDLLPSFSEQSSINKFLQSFLNNNLPL